MDVNNSNIKRKSSAGDSKYLPELLAEKDSLDSSFTHAMKLLSAGQCFFIHYESIDAERLPAASGTVIKW